ncbi:hypothetical protein COV20_04605 [Candidatus Woesearchaeota archaeon CG10_big_fil_rev_8_21_14_0_10_45_16]|nr:MAG: hypothetical protein COV20_04605 [Candidatus Woesearchaeota archaeon CG10_big_fil_rev_8_21_14_0_10_45_16]
MSSLWLLTKKSLKVLIRSKSSALIVIFAPLLIILVLGLAYNTNERFGLNIGVYAPSFTDDVNSFVSILQEDEFTIIPYDSSIEQCVDDIRSGLVHTCISLPSSLKVEDNNPKDIVFYVDPSRVNLVWMVQETVKGKFELRSQTIREELSQNILTKLMTTKDGIAAQNSLLSSVKEQQNSFSASTEAVKQQLSTLDLTLPESSYSTESVDTIKSSINSSHEKIGEALDSLDSLNISSGQKADIKDALEKAQEELSSSLTLVEGNASSSVLGIIAILEQDLASARVKLQAAAERTANSQTILETASGEIAQTLEQLNSISDGLGKLQQNIESQQVTEAGTIASPLNTKIEKVSTEGTYLSYLFPALLILVVMFSSLALGTTLVMVEKNSPAFIRNFFLPIKKVTFIASIYFTNLILILIQIAVILLISLFFLSDSIAAFPTVAFILFVAASVFTFLGMVVGYIFKSEETGILASISLGSLLLFISGLILPLEGIAPLLRGLVSLNPFVIAEGMVREVFIFGAPFTNIWIDLLILISYAVALFLIILIIESFLHDHLVERMIRHHREKQQRPK